MQLYPDFFCRYEDPSYLKALKIEVLIAIADATNAYEIAEEMTQVCLLGGWGVCAGGWGVVCVWWEWGPVRFLGHCCYLGCGSCGHRSHCFVWEGGAAAGHCGFSSGVAAGATGTALGGWCCSRLPHFLERCSCRHCSHCFGRWCCSRPLRFLGARQLQAPSTLLSSLCTCVCVWALACVWACLQLQAC